MLLTPSYATHVSSAKSNAHSNFNHGTDHNTRPHTMIEHCVFVRFKSSVTPEQRLALVQAFEGLVGRIDGLLSVAAGVNTPYEAKSHGFGHGFIVRLTDAQALSAYQQDKQHQALGAALVAAADGGENGILVFDMVHDARQPTS